MPLAKVVTIVVNEVAPTSPILRLLASKDPSDMHQDSTHFLHILKFIGCVGRQPRQTLPYTPLNSMTAQMDKAFPRPFAATVSHYASGSRLWSRVAGFFAFKCGSEPFHPFLGRE